MNTLELISFILILGAAVLGGYYPLTKREQVQSGMRFEHGESFTSGVFLALSLFIMLPAGFHLFGKATPNFVIPLAPVVGVIAFMFLLAIEHITEASRDKQSGGLSSPSIPIIMTIMISFPSFMLGTALGISDTETAIFILIAVLAHKSSAGFGLALNMVTSKLSKYQCYLLYGLFAIATPLGIVAGAEARQFLGSESLLLVKAITLSFASGVFLYLATIHNFGKAPLITHCSKARCFVIMLIGLIITLGVKAILDLGHAG
ncbi:MAG: ZIP family metal transporter [Thermodesulfobacteriota bacterium]